MKIRLSGFTGSTMKGIDGYDRMGKNNRRASTN